MTIRNALLAGIMLQALVVGRVQAEGSTYTGLSLTSDYVVGGVTQNAGKPALQGYVEHDLDNGLYAGLWVSRVDFSAFGASDRFELDAYVGYRGETGKLRYDLTYYRYYYDAAGFDSDELWGKLTYAIGEHASVGVNLRAHFHGVFEDEFLYGPTFEFGLGEKTSLDGDLTLNTLNDDRAWSVGLRQQLTDTLSTSIRYHDSDFDAPRLEVSLSWDTDFAALAAH